MAAILVVDDRSPNRDLLRTILGYNGHIVLEASDGAQALELVKAERPALVISDILMPTMDGYELVRQMRTHPEGANVPVIFSTAHYLDREAKALAESCGVSHIIYKPADPEVILSTVDAVLGRSPASVPADLAEQFDREHSRVLTDKLAQKTEDLRRANERLGALIELGHQLAAERDPLYLLESFCHSARRIVGARYAAIAVLDEDTQTVLHFFTSGMTPEATAAIGSRPVGRGLLGLLLKEGGVVRLRDLSSHARSEGFPQNHPPMKSFLGAAISSSTGLYGSLYLTDKIGFDEFSEADERLMAMLVAQVGIAYENARRNDQIQHRASELERTVEQLTKAEETLREANQTLQSLVQTSPLAIIAMDLEGIVKNWNSAAERIFGWPAHEVTGRYNPIIPVDRRDEFQGFLEMIRKDETLTGIETSLIKKDETLIDVSLSAAPLIDGKGDIHGSVAVIADITEHKQLEEQFRQSQKMEAIGRLAGGIAHDFNNLLTAVIGYSQIVLARLQNCDPMRKEIEEIEKAGHRAAALTSQLLTFSRRQVLQPRVLCLNAVVADMSKLIHRLIGEDIELKTTLDPRIGFVKADQGQIEQIVMNLAVNARDAMPNGGKLTIETSSVELDDAYTIDHLDARPGSYSMLSISDNGSGIDDQIRSRIFEPFFTTKEQGKGTGLGLSTVYGIVKQSGGHIGVYSETDVGTTFKIYLPRVEEAGAPVSARASETAVPNGTETILLVEDEDTVLRLAQVLLESHGYRVLATSDGEEALRICVGYAGTIDMLLTDVIMPGNGGREIAQRVSRLRPDIKVLYMSGYTDDAIVRLGVLDADTHFLQKPFTRDSLLRKVRVALDETQTPIDVGPGSLSEDA